MGARVTNRSKTVTSFEPAIVLALCIRRASRVTDLPTDTKSSRPADSGSALQTLSQAYSASQGCLTAFSAAPALSLREQTERVNYLHRHDSDDRRVRI